MGSRAKIKGLRADVLMDRAARDILKELAKPARRAAAAGARVLRDKAREIVSRTYPGGHAPEGEPPGKISGALRKAIKTGSSRFRRGVASAPVKVDHPAGGRLEFGGSDRHGRRIRAHPYMRKAAELADDDIGRAMEAELDKP